MRNNNSSMKTATIRFSVTPLALLSFSLPIFTPVSRFQTHCFCVTTAAVRLCVKTGILWWNSGTDADVHVRLLGPTGCRTPWINLDNPGDDFEYNAYDCFEFSTVSVGYEVQLTSVCYNYLQCVTLPSICYNYPQCVTMTCNVLQLSSMCNSYLQCITITFNVYQMPSKCYNYLQCVTVTFKLLQLYLIYFFHLKMYLLRAAFIFSRDLSSIFYVSLQVTAFVFQVPRLFSIYYSYLL